MGYRKIYTAGVFMNKEKLHVFSKIPTLQTKRLTLRKMVTRDAEDMFEYAQRPEVSEYLLWRPHDSLKFSKNYISFLQTLYSQKNFYDWAVIFRETGKMIGTCGFTNFDLQNNSAEVGYVLNSDYWGYGLAPEALWRVIEFGFLELNLHRIEAKIIAGNTRSEQVAKKCGLRHEATLKNSMYIKDKYKTIEIYAILDEEYLARI